MGSAAWLKASQLLAINNGAIAFELALNYQQAEQFNRAIFWSQQASKLKQPEAPILLAKIYIEQQRYQPALEVLAPLVNSEQWALIQSVKIIIALGQLPKLAPLVIMVLIIENLGSFQSTVFSHFVLKGL